MFNKKHMAVMLMSSALLACGSSNDSDPTPTPSPSTTALSGAVVDGYVYNALVWLDLNHDQLPDDNEPQVRTALDGTYTFDLDEDTVASLAGVSVIAQLDNQSYDVGDVPPSTMEDFDSLVADGSLSPVTSNENVKLNLASPPFMTQEINALSEQTAVTGKAITPYTNEVYEALLQDLESLRQGGLTAEQQQVAIDSLVDTEQQSQLARYTQTLEQAGVTGIDPSMLAQMLQGDFIASGDDQSAASELQEHAQGMVSGKVQDLETADDLAQLPENQGWDISYTTTTGQNHYIPFNMDEAVTVETKQVVVTRTHSQDQVQERLVSYQEYADQNGEQLLFSDSDVRELTSLADNSFKRWTHYQTDLGLNGEFLEGFTYEEGVVEELDGVEYTSYFKVLDEGNPLDFGGVNDIPSRSLDFDSAEALANAYLAGELEDISVFQYFVESTEYTSEYVLHTVVFEEFANTDTPFTEKFYSEQRENQRYYDGRSHYIVRKDWGADGSFNEISSSEIMLDGSKLETESAPVWGDFEEYPGFLFWEERYTEEGGVDENGNEVSIHGAIRYLLDTGTASKYLNASGEALVFNQYSETETTLPSGEKRTYTAWDHFYVDDPVLGGFDNPTFDASGHKYVSSEYEREFYEYWGRFIEDLPALLDPLMDLQASTSAILARQLSASLKGYTDAHYSGELCDVALEGADATVDAYMSAIANCGEDLGLTADEVRYTTLARSRSGGEAFRAWVLGDEYEPLLRVDIESEGVRFSEKPMWLIDSDLGHLEFVVGDDLNRLIAPYAKFDGGAAVIVADYNPQTEEVVEIWSSVFVEIDTWWIPELVE